MLGVLVLKEVQAGTSNTAWPQTSCTHVSRKFALQKGKIERKKNVIGKGLKSLPLKGISDNFI